MTEEEWEEISKFCIKLDKYINVIDNTVTLYDVKLSNISISDTCMWLYDVNNTERNAIEVLQIDKDGNYNLENLLEFLRCYSRIPLPKSLFE